MGNPLNQGGNTALGEIRLQKVQLEDGTWSYRETDALQEIFELWYACDRNFMKLYREHGYSHMATRRYANIFNWHKRADERDRQAAIVKENVALDRIAKMQEDHYNAAQMMIELGLDYLEQNQINDEKTAIAAVKTGIEIQRRAVGLPDWVGRITQTPTDQLMQEMLELTDAINRARSTQPALNGGADGASEEGNGGQPIDAEFRLESSEPGESSGLHEVCIGSSELPNERTELLSVE